MKGSGSAVANSFLHWGKAIMADMVQKGDVLIDHRGRGDNATGGHVGLATGRTQIGRNGQRQIEMIAGNSSDKVQTTWENASKLAVRRANEALAGPAGTFSGVGKPAVPGAAIDLARSNPVAESLARTAPQSRSAGAGRSGVPIAPMFHITESNNPEHTANMVQKRIQDSTNYVTHDVSFESA